MLIMILTMASAKQTRCPGEGGGKSGQRSSSVDTSGDCTTLMSECGEQVHEGSQVEQIVGCVSMEVR